MTKLEAIKKLTAAKKAVSARFPRALATKLGSEWTVFSVYPSAPLASHKDLATAWSLAAELIG